MKRATKRGVVGVVLLAVLGAVGWMFYSRTAMADPGQGGAQGGSDVGRQGDREAGEPTPLGELWRSFSNLFRRRENRR